MSYTMDLEVFINTKDLTANLVYLLRDGDAVKVGISTGNDGFNSRLRTLRCGNPREVTVLTVLPEIERAAFVEALFACLALPFRIRGSWYNMTPDGAEELLHIAHQIAEKGRIVNGTRLQYTLSTDHTTLHMPDLED